MKRTGWVILFIVTLLLVFRPQLGLSAESERRWRNLAGLAGVSSKISINLYFKGAGALALDMLTFKSAVVSQLQRAKLLKSSNDGVPSLIISISGRTWDGKDGAYQVSLKLLGSVKSPFREDKTLVAVLWQTEISHSQVYYYNPETEKVEPPTTKIADKLKSDALILVGYFIKDVRKANASNK